LKIRFTTTKKDGHEQNREDRAGQHAADDADADGVLGCPNPRRWARRASGNHAEDEGERGHQDRPQPHPRGVQGGFDQTMSGFELLLGELDNQDGVLRGQTDGREQSDLEIDIRWASGKKNAASTAPTTPSGTTSMTEAEWTNFQ